MRRRLASWVVSGLFCLLMPYGTPLAKTEDITLRQSQAEREQHDLRERIRALRNPVTRPSSPRQNQPWCTNNVSAPRAIAASIKA